MENSKKQNIESSESEIVPVTAPEQVPKPVVKKPKLLTCSVFTGGSALLAVLILFSSHQLYRRYNRTQNENFLGVKKIQCNRATSSNQLYQVLKTSPRSSWPPVTTINGREYTCISNYKVDVTDIRNDKK